MTEPAKIRIVFLGTPAFACPALQALAADPRYEILCVVTQPDRPAGRGHKLTPPPIKILADTLGLSVFQTPSIKKDEALKAHLMTLQPDFLVTVAFGQILTQDILDMPKWGTVNAHASLLPELRGANPIQWAILQGKTETGVTAMLTELGVDTGPMLQKFVTPIGELETLGELTERLSQASGPLLVEALAGMFNGTVQPQVQPHDQATHAPKLDKDAAILSWEEPGIQLLRKIRAFNPSPGAATFLGAERVKILRARPANGPDSENFLKTGRSGEILAIIESGILVRTGDGVLEITHLQPAGKREMSARDWARGMFRDGTLGCFERPQAAETLESVQRR